MQVTVDGNFNVQAAAAEQAVLGLVAEGIGVALVSSSLSSVRPEEVAYHTLVDPPLEAEFEVARFGLQDIKARAKS